MTDAAGKILTEFNLYFARGFGAPNAAQLSKGGRYTRSWQNNGAQEVLAPPATDFWEPPADWSWLTDIADGFRASNPSTRSGLYVGSGVWARSYEPAYSFLNHTTEAFHTPDGLPLVYHSGGPYNPGTGAGGYVAHQWFNVSLPGIRERLAAAYVDFCEAEGFDGIFFDSYDPAAHAQWIREVPYFGLSGGILEGPYHTQAAWEEILSAWAPEAQAALEASGRRLILNGLLGVGASTTWGGYGNTNLVTLASGVIAEDAQDMYKNPPRFDEGIRIIRAAADLGGEVFFWIQPRLLDPPHAPVAYTLGVELARFYLATFLLVDSEERMSFGYHPGTVYQGLLDGQPYIHWEDDWDLEYGHPTGHRFDGGTTLPWWRRFTKGYAVVNQTATPFTFREPGNFRVWHPTDGPVISIGPEADSWYHMPANTGHFLFEVEAA